MKTLLVSHLRRGFVIFRVALGSMILSSGLTAQTFVPQYKPTLHIPRSVGDIRIDGHLDDPGWVGAAVAGDFCETNPGDQIAPPVETKVMITYDDDKLYAAFVCYDEPSEVRASMCERDRLQNDDKVGLFIDTAAGA